MNTFCIPIKVENEEDLYDRFLPSGLSFSGELMAYLEDYLEDRRPGEGVCLELYAANEPDMNHFRNAYQTFLEKIIQRNNRAIHLADLKAVLSLVMGTAFISIGLALAGSVDQIVSEIIYSIGSFGMWAAIAAFIETIPTLRARKKRLELFSRA